MNQLLKRTGLVCLLAGALSSSAFAGHIVIQGAQATGSWGTTGCGGQYSCANTFDGVTDDVFGDPASWWLGREATAGEAISFDLGGIFAIGGFDIYNTHNGGAGDRGTDHFNVWVSGDLVDLTADSSTWGTPVISNGQLAFFTSGSNPLQSFGISPVLGQYVTFQAVDYYFNGAGLAEFQVSEAVPEPGTTSLMAAGLGLGALYLRRRKRA